MVKTFDSKIEYHKCLEQNFKTIKVDKIILKINYEKKDKICLYSDEDV